MDLALLILISSCLVCVSSNSRNQIPADPPGFIWGTATASYQVEGAVKEDGRLPSIWDTFSHTTGKTYNGDTGDVADDNYHRFEEDIKLMTALGLKAYRMSIAWPRIIPDGESSVNQAGIAHYNTVINALLAAGITPFITLYHWDIPQNLDTKYGGWLNNSMATYFSRYADVCFNAFGDRITYWTTFNEPLTFCNVGYNYGTHAPGRCSDRSKCSAGNSSTEPYLCAHSVLLAHSAAVQVYRTKYQSTQKGKIGLTLNTDWAVPMTTSSDDAAAAQRNMEFQCSWFADPVWFGDYPQSMKSAVGSRLPQFTANQSIQLKGSWDFYAMNHYTTKYVSNRAIPNPSSGWDDDQGTSVTPYKNGVPIGTPADSDWLFVVPYGIRNMLNWAFKRYGGPPIYITENGVDVPGESNMTLQQALNDTFRINFYQGYIDNVMLAVGDGVDVRSYFAWSLMDNFEWADGYNKRFGMHYVDYNNNLTRYQKQSALWYANRTKGNSDPFKTRRQNPFYQP